MTEGDLFLTDTNILVYYFDKSDDKKHLIAKDLIGRCLKKETNLALSSQNLSEFFSVVVRKKYLPRNEALKFLSYLIKFSGLKKINFNHKTVLEAARISDGHDMSYWDSLLAATMKQNGILNLYTENVKDFKVPWINAVNPFEKSRGIAKGVTTEDLRDESERFD